jgi:VanZ family protein
LVLAVTVVVQLVVLYAPRAPATPSIPGVDKVVHVGIFGAVAWAAVRCGLAPRVVALVLVVHAALSEVLQHALLAHRSGDPADAVADTVGVVLGLALGRSSRRAARRVPDRGRSAEPTEGAPRV